MPTTRWRRSVAALVVLAAAGCGGTEADVTGGFVTGTVHYSGTVQGKLAVAAFREWPTLSAPENFKWIESPSYPQAYRLEPLDPGDYYMFAFIDLPPLSPTLPGAEDIKSTPTSTTHVSESEPAEADISIP
jgi:hypothetical protein